MLLYTVHINECEHSPCCSESYWEDVCMCVWLRMHAYMSTRAQIRVYGEGFSMTHWLTSPEAQWGCVYWWRNPVNEERRIRASTRHSNLFFKTVEYESENIQFNQIYCGHMRSCLELIMHIFTEKRKGMIHQHFCLSSCSFCLPN